MQINAEFFINIMNDSLAIEWYSTTICASAPVEDEERSSAEAISNPPPDESALRIAKRVWETYMGEATAGNKGTPLLWAAVQHTQKSSLFAAACPSRHAHWKKIDGLTVRPG